MSDLDKALGVVDGQVVPTDGGCFVCQGCREITPKLYRGDDPRTARCIRCLAGLSARVAEPVSQMGLGL